MSAHSMLSKPTPFLSKYRKNNIDFGPGQDIERIKSESISFETILKTLFEIDDDKLASMKSSVIASWDLEESTEYDAKAGKAKANANANEKIYPFIELGNCIIQKALEEMLDGNDIALPILRECLIEGLTTSRKPYVVNLGDSLSYKFRPTWAQNSNSKQWKAVMMGFDASSAQKLVYGKSDFETQMDSYAEEMLSIRRDQVYALRFLAKGYLSLTALHGLSLKTMVAIAEPENLNPYNIAFEATTSIVCELNQLDKSTLPFHVDMDPTNKLEIYPKEHPHTNLGYYIGEQTGRYIGAFLDFDLASMGEAQGSSTHARPSTAPYMAREVLDVDAPYIHSFQHELESLLCVVIWHALDYVGNASSEDDVLRYWRKGSWGSIRKVKNEFFSASYKTVLKVDDNKPGNNYLRKRCFPVVEYFHSVKMYADFAEMSSIGKDKEDAAAAAFFARRTKNVTYPRWLLKANENLLGGESCTSDCCV